MNEERIEELAQTIEAAEHKDTSGERYHNMFLYAPDEGRNATIVINRRVVAAGFEKDPAIIEGLPSHFTLSWFCARADHDSCETVGCIAGYCAGLYVSEVPRADIGIGDFVDFTKEALGISYEVASNLCAPWDLPFDQITPRQAAQAVRNLLTLTGDDLDGDDIYAGRKALATKLWGHALDDKASTA